MFRHHYFFGFQYRRIVEGFLLVFNAKFVNDSLAYGRLLAGEQEIIPKTMASAKILLLILLLLLLSLSVLVLLFMEIKVLTR